MPHLKLDATSNVLELDDIPQILRELVAELCRHETMMASSVKAYFREQSVWAMGEGARPGFVHLEVAVLEGRPLELKRAIAQALRGVIERGFARSIAEGRVGITIEIRDMDRSTYLKTS
jgi:5-carboxymethyl-2-hydroxymuconate isomerase